LLASSSPRRLTLLRQVLVEPDGVVAPDVDETPHRGELPRACALRLAAAKARAVATQAEGCFVLAADTVGAAGRRSLPKCDSEAEARRCLELLSGRRHRVLGGVCALAPDGRISQRLVATIVRFKRLTLGDVELYLASDEWRGKAGGYAIQGLAAAFVPA